MKINKSWIKFTTVGGTYIDFSQLDLTPWGIKGGLVNSKSTEEFIRTNYMPGQEDRNWKHVKEVSQSSDGMGGVAIHGDWEYMNLLCPLEFNNSPSDNDYFEAIGAIKVIHISEFNILNNLDEQYFEGI